jgi:hypothetical protein
VSQDRQVANSDDRDPALFDLFYDVKRITRHG